MAVVQHIAKLLDRRNVTVISLVSELSETQNYAYWYARFFPGTHGFR